MRIMVVDDNEVVGRSIRRLLRPNLVVLETNPDRALDRILFGFFDLVFCDQHMPESLGTELFGALRDKLGDRVPLLVLMSGDDDIVSPLADAVLTKPFQQAELLALVDLAAARTTRYRPPRRITARF